MRKHTKIYLAFLAKNGIDPHEARCELTGVYAGSLFVLDIHHIDCKGMGGSKKKDFIENLMATTRQVHLYFGDKIEYYDFLVTAHKSYLNTLTPWLELNPNCPTLKKFLNAKASNSSRVT